MESTSTPPAKRLRTIKNANNLQLTECVREFTLHRQFPSLATAARNKVAAPSVKDEAKVPANAAVPEAAKNVSSKEGGSKIQKLRLKSQDGRDLGEFNVQFLSKKDSTVNAKIIKKADADSGRKCNSITALTTVPAEKTSKLENVPQMPPKPSVNSNPVVLSGTVIPSNQSTITSNIIKTESGIKTITSHRPLILSKRKTCMKNVDFCTNSEVRNNGQKDVVLIKRIFTDRRKAPIVPISDISKYIKLKHNPEATLKNEKNNGNLVPDKQSDIKNPRGSLNGETLEMHNKIQSLDINEAPLKIVQHKQIVESSFPLVQCENGEQVTTKTVAYIRNRLKLEPQTVDQAQKSTDHISSVATKSSECTEKSPVKLNIPTATKKLKTKDKKLTYKRQKARARISSIGTVSKQGSSIVQKDNGSIPQNSQQDKEKLEENESANKNTVHIENQETSKNKDSTSSPVLNEKTLPNSHTGSTDMKISSDKTAPCVQQSDSITSTTTSNASEETTRNLTVSTDNSSDRPTDVPLKEKFPEQWSIIEKAVSSVKDEELRAKALKALADCGIGIERSVPICPPEQLRAVNDSQIQTEVFSLLDPKSFVLVRDELPNLQRINEIQRTSLHPPSNNSTPFTHNRQTQNNLIHNEVTFVDPNITHPVCNSQIFDDFFNDFCNINECANKVKEVLSTPNTLIRKISAQLKKDFDELKTWDEDGMLNIHRAIVNNDVNAVQRLLMVIKACKESVDVCTDEEMTCLELAIKFDAPAEIVKLLLDAGAEPASPKLAHDSALIIASKSSSPMLPLLVSYMKATTLLDQTDSLGFTALHHCALNGNLEGSNALIQAGANVNVRDHRSGRTAFFHALENDYLTLAQRLLDAGAVADTPNFAGQTVLMLIDDVKNLSLRNALSKLV